MADALQDFVTFTGALGGLTDSVARLYDMKVQVRTERAEAELARLNTAFLDRMRLPLDDPNRIDDRNWRDALSEHDAMLSSYVGNIDEGAVRDRVSNNIESMRSQFHNAMANELYQKEVERTQVDRFETYKSDAALLANLAKSADDATFAASRKAFEDKLLLDDQRGLFSPAVAAKHRAEFLGIVDGTRLGDSELKKRGYDFDATAMTISASSASEEAKKAAIAYIKNEQAVAEASTKAKFSEAERAGGYDAVESFLASGEARGGAAFMEGLRTEAFSMLLGQTGANVREKANKVIAYAQRGTAPAYAAYMAGKKAIQADFNALPLSLRNNENVVKDFEAEIDRLDRLAAEESEKGGSKSSLEGELNLYRTCYLNKRSVDASGIPLTLDQYYAKAIQCQAAGIDVTAQMKEIETGKILNASGAVQDILGKPAVINAAAALFRASPKGIPGVERGEFDAASKAFFGDKKASALDKQRADEVASEIVQQGVNYARTGAIKTEAELIDFYQKALIPRLRVWNTLSVEPQKNAAGGITGIRDYLLDADAGGQAGRYTKSPQFGEKGGEYNDVRASKQILETIRGVAGPEMAKLQKEGFIPKDFVPVERDGDFFLEKEGENVRYSVNASEERAVGYDIVREEMKDGKWVPVESITSGKDSVTEKAAETKLQKEKVDAASGVLGRVKPKSAAEAYTLLSRMNYTEKQIRETLLKSYDEESVNAAMKNKPQGRR